MAGSASERLIRTAAEVFRREGFHAAGIDQILREAGVARMTLYNNLGSKEELIARALELTNGEALERMVRRVEELSPEAGGRPLAVFDALGEWFRSGSFLGCLSINAACEFHDPAHPAHRAAAAYKRALRATIERWVEEAGYEGSGALARRLTLLAEGAIVTAHVLGEADAAEAAREAAATLLSASPRRAR